MVPIGGFFQETGGQWIFVLDPSESFATKEIFRLAGKIQNIMKYLKDFSPVKKLLSRVMKPLARMKNWSLKNTK